MRNTLLTRTFLLINGNGIDMNHENQRLARIERKVDWILRVVGIQFTLFLGILLWYGISYAVRMASSVALILIVAVPVLYLFRKSLPASVVATLKRGVNLLVSLLRFKSESIQDVQEA